MIRLNVRAFASAGLVVLVAASAKAQVGENIMDMNAVTEAQLERLPNMTPDLTKGLLGGRPFADITKLNTFLLENQKLTPVRAAEIYRKVFVHVDLNNAPIEQLRLIPGITDTAPRDIMAKRPWKSLAQFNIDFAKAASPALADRWVQYLFIQMNANSASDQDLATIPGGGTKATAEIKAHRPYSSKQQFETEVGKGLGAPEAARISRFFAF
jgi:DNA uptake protein ComE-like DNA-binding protein